MWIIYKLTSPSNKSYIGYTKRTLEERFQGHCKDTSRGRVLVKAINKYGATAFNKEIIETVENLEEAKSREIYWIDHFKTNHRDFGYNMTKGGDGVDSKNASYLRHRYYKSDEGKEWREELSNKWKTNNPCKDGNIPWNKGLKGCFNEETLNKMSNSHKERYKDPEARAKQSEIVKRNWENGAYDNRPPPTPETIAKRAEARRGSKQTEYQKQRAREANLGKIVSAETRKKVGDANRGRKLDEKICPHCGKNSPGGNYNRWHGDNCRHKKIP